ncbi:MAG: FadR family transcriptional regulator [Pseudomonadales bacterium]|nr:FadR family transcriptional regulator [Pseudomonadales bacterium]MBO6564253.1 FadR family transcriptional regulator [Pseudomonadales bacterium]MBO6597078.1 FadR family transcriptional regulator [Pseudomonadales bacterium]MBO6656107.1 FadR family transcriptional regulator [Pseudomonadales bacterium]MBO6703720.1 FadR family transcriptional regulator [Pseudomonadales bacterium]
MNTPKSGLTPLKKRPAYLMVFDALEEEILSGRLAEGDSVPTEMALCEQFDVQRSTVREGIRLLEQSGLVVRNGKRLTVVRPKTEEAAESASRGLARHGVRFIDVWEANLAILPGTARLAAQKIRAKDRKRLSGITTRLSTTEQSEEIVSLGIEYLMAIAEVTGNRVLGVMVHSLKLLLESSLQQVIEALPNPRDRIVRAQTEINQALEGKDADQAEAWMLRHLEDLRRGYLVAGVDLSSEVGTFL